MPDIATIEAELAEAEAQVPNLRPGCEKRIRWHDAAAVQTDLAIVYLHGFSASAEELRPLPDLVADAFGANLFFTRLAGHGQDGAAMGRATLAAWKADVVEAVAVGKTIGKDVIIMGCSTGCTLATVALAEGADVKAVVHVSPNFGLRNRAAQFLLDLPASRRWAKYVAGATRRFEPISEAHQKYWTTEYPTAAVHVMADAVRAARAVNLSSIETPALFCFNPEDQVVHAAHINKVLSAWGGPTERVLLRQTPEDDAMGHVMAGDIFSPGQTLPLAEQIIAWLKNLPDC